MKRFLLVGLLFSIAAWGFSQNTQEIVQDRWVTYGFEGGSYFENYKYDGDSYSDYTLSPGFAINSYSFVQDGIGMFARMSLLFPTYISSKENGVEQDDSRGDYSTMMQVAMLVGPAFKFSIGDRADLYFGMGVGFMFSNGYIADDILQPMNTQLTSAGISSTSVTSASVTTTSTSLGVDLGFKVDLTDMMFINVGASASWEFLVNKDMSVNFKLSGEDLSWTKSMNVTGAFNIRPYICIGFSSYAISQTGTGRAPR